jgi:hypothetical protein
MSGTRVCRQELVPVYDWKSPDGFKVLITTENQERNPHIHNKKTSGGGMAFWPDSQFCHLVYNFVIEVLDWVANSVRLRKEWFEKSPILSLVMYCLLNCNFFILLG